MVIGVPQQFSSMSGAEEYAESVVKASDNPHATIIAVDSDWDKWTMVAENRGVVLTTMGELTRSIMTYDTEDKCFF